MNTKETLYFKKKIFNFLSADPQVCFEKAPEDVVLKSIAHPLPRSEELQKDNPSEIYYPFISVIINHLLTLAQNITKRNSLENDMFFFFVLTADLKPLFDLFTVCTESALGSEELQGKH